MALFSKYPENYLELLESKNKPVEVVEEVKPVVIKKRKTKKKS